MSKPVESRTEGIVGAFFVSESVNVFDSEKPKGGYSIACVFDGMAGLYVHMTEELATDLYTKLGAMLLALRMAEVGDASDT